MRKYCFDLSVSEIEHLTTQHILLRLTHTQPLPQITPGQFVEVRIDNSPTTFLRRPFSVNFVDYTRNELWLLIHVVGDGTAALARLKEGNKLNCILPLGNGFTLPNEGERLLLIGGGVGVAPLLYLGAMAKERKAEPIFLLGAKTADELIELDRFKDIGKVFITTEDGTAGERGMVTNHSIFERQSFDRLQVCGPLPMMKAVAQTAMQQGIDCEVSLENMMACGIGACLCCVEKTVDGNLCVCKDGPIFNVRQLLWHV